MEIQTGKSKFKVKIDGKEYFISSTKLKHQLLIDDLIESTKEGKPTGKIMIDLLTELGLPREVCGELDEDDLIEIIKGMAKAKKNSQTPTSNSPSSKDSTAGQ